MRRTGEFLQKRRLEADVEATGQLSKKARKDNSEHRSELAPNLSRDLSGYLDVLKSNGNSAEFHKAVELHLSVVYKERAKLVRELEDTRDKLKISEERVTRQAKELEQNNDLLIRIARLEADVECNVKKVEEANRESLNQMERAKAMQRKHEIESKQYAATVEQLKSVCEQLAQSKAEVKTTLGELAHQSGELEKLERDKNLLEKRLDLEQRQAENEGENQGSSRCQQPTAGFIVKQIELQKEVRLAKEESGQLKSKLVTVMKNHVSKLQRLQKLNIKYETLVRENESKCAELATLQVEKIKHQEGAKINDCEMVKIKGELERVMQTMKMRHKHYRLSSEKQQETTSFSVVTKPIHQLQIHNVVAIAVDMLADLRGNKDSDWSEYPCSNCQLHVEEGFQCSDCPDFQLCIPCREKDEHHHKMEKFGFGLTRSKSNFMDPKEEERKSRVDRRVISLVHSFNCSDANCLVPFCRTMKLVVAHNAVCHTKTLRVTNDSPVRQSRCLVCRQLVGLILCRAKHCTALECAKPYCKSLKKQITCWDR